MAPYRKPGNTRVTCKICSHSIRRDLNASAEIVRWACPRCHYSHGRAAGHTFLVERLTFKDPAAPSPIWTSSPSPTFAPDRWGPLHIVDNHTVRVDGNEAKLPWC